MSQKRDHLDRDGEEEGRLGEEWIPATVACTSILVHSFIHSLSISPFGKMLPKWLTQIQGDSMGQQSFASK